MGEAAEQRGPTAFIGNPPYVRHHLIERRWKEWLHAEAKRLDLPASGLAGLHVHFFLRTAVLAAPGDIGTFVTSAEWLDVNNLDELDPSERRAVERFLRVARADNVHEGYIARHRKCWWSVGLRAPAPIIATYMARRPPAFVRNPVGAHHVKVAHGLYPREPMTSVVLDRPADALSASVTTDGGRIYAGGLTKFEPGEMARLAVPSLDLLVVNELWPRRLVSNALALYATF